MSDPVEDTGGARQSPAVPPHVGYAVVEGHQFAPQDGNTFDPVVTLKGLHATRDRAEREAENIRDVMEMDEAPDLEWSTVRVQKKTLYSVDGLQRMDEDSYGLLRDAADAVAEGLIRSGDQ